MEQKDADHGPWTVSRLLAWTRDYLQRHAVESPRLCAELLLAHALACPRLELFTRPELVPSAAQLDGFRTTVREVAAGKPLAYVTGCKEFFSLRFEVSPDVLVPRPETEVLVERMIGLARHGPGSPRRILDVGTGSGCIAIALARHLPDAQIAAGDISPEALAVARRNAERLGVLPRIDFRVSDLAAAWRDDEPFDALVANPPYIGLDEADSLPRNVRDFEPALALFAGADGMDVLRRLPGEARSVLRGGGHLLVEVSHRQAAAVRRLLSDAGWRDVTGYLDGLRIERVLHARWAPAGEMQVA